MRLLLADDHALFRSSLRSLLEIRGFEVIAEASNAKEAIELSLEHRPDIILMDISMPDETGLVATRKILEQWPQAPIVILTASNEDEDFIEALRIGARGYILKNLEVDAFCTNLERIKAGETVIPADLSRHALLALADQNQHRGDFRDPTQLTDREVEVLRQMLEGITSNRALSRSLGVSENTIKFHVRNILEKLGANDRAQALAIAIQRRLISR